MSPLIKVSEVTMLQLFNYLSELIERETGNVLADNEYSMVESRVKKRILELSLTCPGDYLEYINSNFQTEKSKLIGMLTTHHTFFFREYVHFDFLSNHLPKIIEFKKKTNQKKIKILSLACSRGEEVYSLAMFFNHELRNYPTAEIDFEILGTDIDPESIDVAKKGIYQLKSIKSIPTKYLTGNWMKGKGNIADFAKVKPALKDKCSFREGNLLNVESEFANNTFDIIFCRNVFIYFDKQQVAKVAKNILKILSPKGILITGVSESLGFCNLDVESLYTSVYRVKSDSNVEEESVIKKIPQKTIQKLKLFCVDDSDAVLKLYKKMFANHHQIELIGFAKDGEEAHKFLSKNDVDIMTLDLHMPVMDGISYLDEYFDPENHPPVVIVSSASREDKSHSLRALELGATDFVEKPTFDNFQSVCDEITTKLTVAFKDKNKKNINNSHEKIFAASSSSSLKFENDLVVAFASITNRKNIFDYIELLQKVFREFPPHIISVTGGEKYIEEIFNLTKDKFPHLSIKMYSTSIENSNIYFLPTEMINTHLKETFKVKDVSVCILEKSNDLRLLVESISPVVTLIESKNETRYSGKLIKNDITSYPYLLKQFFLEKDKT